MSLSLVWSADLEATLKRRRVVAEGVVVVAVGVVAVTVPGMDGVAGAGGGILTRAIALLKA